MSKVRGTGVAVVFSAILVVALVVQLAMTLLAPFLPQPGWTYAELALELLDGDLIERSIRSDVEFAKRSRTAPVVDSLYGDQFASTWIACTRSDMTDWLTSGDPQLSVTVRDNIDHAIIRQFKWPCASKLGHRVSEFTRPCGFACGVSF